MPYCHEDIIRLWWLKVLETTITSENKKGLRFLNKVKTLSSYEKGVKKIKLFFNITH